MSARILITALSFSRYAAEPKKYLEEQGFELIWNNKGKPYTEEEMLAIIVTQGPFQGLLVGNDPVTEKIIEAAQGLKVIAKHGVGVDNIDLAAARRYGVIVTNAPGTNHQAVADLTFGLLLAAARSIPLVDKKVRENEWYKVVGCEVWEKTIGIIGTGRIGLAVAKRAQGFNMTVLAYDPFPNQEASRELNIKYVSLTDLVQNADFVSLHAPLTAENYHLINEERLKLMKKEAILINTARGELVDEAALYRALTEKWIRAAALDVYSQEPPVNNMLLKLDNVVATSHIGAYTSEANLRMGMVAARNIVQVLNGEKAEFEVGKM